MSGKRPEKRPDRLPPDHPNRIAGYFEKLTALQAEARICATMIVSESAAAAAMARLEPEDFGDPQYRQFFAVYRYAANSSGVIRVNVETLIPAMVGSTRWEDENAARKWLIGLARGEISNPVACYSAHAINEIRTAARKRRAHDRITQAAETLAHSDLSDAEVVEARNALTDALRSSEGPTPLVSDTILDFLDDMRSEKSSTVPRSTGLDAIDKALGGGLRDGQLIVVAGRTGGGKTSFALQLALNQGCLGASVLVVSLEMSGQECRQRLISQHSGISSTAIQENTYDLIQRQDIVKSQSILGGTVIGIDDTPQRKTVDIEASAIEFQRRRGLHLLIVDYLQLVTPADTKGITRAEQISRITRELKILARTLKVPVIALSQLKRSDDPKAKPRLSDLRESGSIEQDADVVLFVHGCDTGRLERHTASVIVAKQRSGPQCEVAIEWHGPTTSFRDVGQQSDEF